MKQFIMASLLVIAATPLLAAEPSAACAAKRARIESQISQAQAQGRQQQLAGLQKALRANQAHCTDALLATERDSDIHKATKKLADREHKLAQAQAKGDPRKIARQQAALDAARDELAEAQKPLRP